MAKLPRWLGGCGTICAQGNTSKKQKRPTRGNFNVEPIEQRLFAGTILAAATEGVINTCSVSEVTGWNAGTTSIDSPAISTSGDPEAQTLTSEQPIAPQESSGATSESSGGGGSTAPVEDPTASSEAAPSDPALDPSFAAILDQQQSQEQSSVALVSMASEPAPAPVQAMPQESNEQPQPAADPMTELDAMGTGSVADSSDTLSGSSGGGGGSPGSLPPSTTEVSPPPLQGSPQAPTFFPLPDRSVWEGGSVLVETSFTDVDSGQTYSGTVDWGDGSTSELVVRQRNGQWFAGRPHLYAKDGVYHATLTLKDSGGQSTSDAFKVTVRNFAAPVPAAESSDQQLNQPPTVPTHDPVSATHILSGSGSNDTFRLRLDSSGQAVNVFHNVDISATPTAVWDLSEIGGIRVEGGGGDDKLVLDLGGGNFLPVGGISYDGGEGFDILRVINARGEERCLRPQSHRLWGWNLVDWREPGAVCRS